MDDRWRVKSSLSRVSFHLHWVPRIVKFWTESKQCLLEAGEKGKWESWWMGTELPHGMMRKFWNEAKVVAAQHWECTKRLWIVHFKTVISTFWEVGRNETEEGGFGTALPVLGAMPSLTSCIISRQLPPSLTSFFKFWPCHAACGIPVPWPGIKPTSSALEGEVLTIRLPWRSLHFLKNRSWWWLVSEVCFACRYSYRQASLVVQLVKNLSDMQETPVQFLGHKDPLEKG